MLYIENCLFAQTGKKEKKEFSMIKNYELWYFEFHVFHGSLDLKTRLSVLSARCPLYTNNLTSLNFSNVNIHIWQFI